MSMATVVAERTNTPMAERNYEGLFVRTKRRDGSSIFEANVFDRVEGNVYQIDVLVWQGRPVNWPRTTMNLQDAMRANQAR